MRFARVGETMVELMNQRLRPCREGDEHLVIEAIEESRAEIAPFAPWCHPDYSIDDARKWVVMQLVSQSLNAISEFLIVSDDGTLLGACGLNDVDPLAWLADVLARIQDHPAKRIDELFPWNWTTTQQLRAAA